MRLVLFLTFVLLISYQLTCNMALATPDLSPSPEFKLPTPRTYSDDEGTLIQGRKFFPYEVAAGLSYLGGRVRMDEDSTSATAIHLELEKRNLDDHAEALQVNLSLRGIIDVSYGVRKILLEGREHNPYYSLGGGAYLNGAESFAALVNYKTYYFRAGVGLEDIYQLQRQLRTEIYLGYSWLGLSYGLNLSYTIPVSI